MWIVDEEAANERRVVATKPATRSVAKANPKSTHRLRILTMESKKCTSNGFDLASVSWMTAPSSAFLE
ncbi:MAG: hypothetical protein ACOVQM_03835, partial [Pirellula sp.]